MNIIRNLISYKINYSDRNNDFTKYGYISINEKKYYDKVALKAGIYFKIVVDDYFKLDEHLIIDYDDIEFYLYDEFNIDDDNDSYDGDDEYNNEILVDIFKLK